MSLFGWSLPPGCGVLPGENTPEICEVCGNGFDHCICPACKECEEIGDPACYDPKSPRFHGMVPNKEQAESLARWEAIWAEQNRDPEPFACPFCLDAGCEDCPL